VFLSACWLYQVLLTRLDYIANKEEIWDAVVWKIVSICDNLLASSYRGSTSVKRELASGRPCTCTSWSTNEVWNSLVFHLDTVFLCGTQELPLMVTFDTVRRCLQVKYQSNKTSKSWEKPASQKVDSCLGPNKCARSRQVIIRGGFRLQLTNQYYIFDVMELEIHILPSL